MLLLILHISILWTPLTHSPQMIDKELIIDPLLKLESFYPDYFTLLNNGKIYDFQPVRDISLYLDLKLDDIFGWGHTGTITNLVIFYLTIYLLWSIFNKFFDRKISFFLCSIFLAHPLYFLIYIEITQRKHILSFLFMLAVFLTLMKRKNTLAFVKSYFLFLFSILSHPINALMPIWFYYQENKPLNKKTLLKYIPFALIFLAVYFYNSYLYKTVHMPREGIDFSLMKFIPETILYSIGLHFRQFFYPFSFGVFYSLENLSVLIFSFAPLAYGLICYKFIKERFIFLTLPLLIIFMTLYGHKSNVLTIYLQNTYVLTPSFVFLFFVGFILKKKFFHNSFFLIPIILFVISLNYSTHRTDRISFYEYVFPNEPECRSLQTLVVNYIEVGEVEKMVKRGEEWLHQKCFIKSSNVNYVRSFVNTHLIYESSQFSFEEKLYLFQNKYETLNDLVPLELVLKIKYNKDSEDIRQLYSKFDEVKFSSFFVLKSYLGEIIKESCSSYGERSCKKLYDYLERSKSADIVNSYKQNIPLPVKQGD